MVETSDTWLIDLYWRRGTLIPPDVTAVVVDWQGAQVEQGLVFVHELEIDRLDVGAP